MTDEQATGTPQQNLPDEDDKPEEQQESASGGGDSPEGKAEQSQEEDTGGTAGGDAEGGSGDDDEVAKARKAAEEEEAAKEKVKELEENPPENLEDWPDDKAKYETFGGAEGDESYEESVTSKLGPSSLRHREDGGVEIEGEEVDNPEDYKGDPIPGGPTDPRVSDSRAYGEPDLTEETSLDVKEEDGQAKAEASDDDESSDGDGESSDGDDESSDDTEKSSESS